MQAKQQNIFYAQSGGVTSVINASACGLIEAARKAYAKGLIGKVYAGRDGIIGALTEDLIDTTLETDEDVASLKYTPGGAFGSCRYKLKDLSTHLAQYQRLIEVFKAHDIAYFFYNGGNDSMDTAWKISQIAEKMQYPLTCLGIPKTVDNDLPHTDCCPGFGSVAKYVATSMREVGFDIASMSRTSTKVFVMEVMGRHAGWITAACGLAAEDLSQSPHLLLFPEIAFNEELFMEKVQSCVQQYGFCTIAVSEGLSDAQGKLIAEMGSKDAFGHSQLGGVGQIIAEKIKSKLGYKYHWSLVDYLQRSARHLASKTDVDQAYALGQSAIEVALSGNNAVMLAIKREQENPYRWSITNAPLAEVANVEKKMPKQFISADGFHITDACRSYLLPLIEGEDPPAFKAGLPNYVRLKNISIEKKLSTFVI